MTLAEVVAGAAARRPDAPALIASSGVALTYERLADVVHDLARSLQDRGLEDGDRVALVMPNGPALALAFLAISSGMACAPLNPAYTRDEFAFYLSDLRARAVIAATAFCPPAEEAARDLGIAIFRVDPSDANGIPRLVGAPEGRLNAASAHRLDDTALLLHTSGTTARPRLVPLSHSNLTASAERIAASLALTTDDRCLNLMPLFHVHGLIGALASSLMVGASVVCLPGVDALRFPRWLGEHVPTWSTAAPAILSAILRTRPRDTARTLRFIRSCSAPLLPRLMADLETHFDVPVVEAYGMTEASHQIATNLLPPASRLPGSVGRAFGTIVTALDGHGNPVGTGETGEIAIQGPGVTRGYLADPEANASTFSGRWFRTGDLGTIDAQGAIRLVGRLKEIINRAGEKISPFEIDAVLTQHPSVAEAVVFGVPHDRLGEDVAAAVVLRPGRPADEAELRGFVAERVAEFKTPRRILLLPEIPKGPSGKVKRGALAERLGLA